MDRSTRMKNNGLGQAPVKSAEMNHGEGKRNNGLLPTGNSNHNSPLLRRHSPMPIPVSPRYPENGRKRKLVLHFDVRNTILVADSVTNVKMEQALNSFLAGVVWGRDLPDGSWEWLFDEPSLSPPRSECTTYYRHLENQIVKTPQDRELLRFKTGDFAQSELGSKFLPHFNRHLELLRWNYPFVESRDRRLAMAGQDGKLYHYILPSIYKLIHKLTEDKRDFSVIIRTYGLDGKNVLSSLAYGLKGNHPGFPQDSRMPVSTFPGYIRRHVSGEITLETHKSDVGDVVKKLTHERDIYRHFSDSSGLSGYKDDFQIWQDKNYHHSFAKPLWIDPNDRHIHHILFDDNFRSYEEDSIVDLRMFDGDDKTQARSLSRKEIVPFEDVCVVQADLLESIENENYFVDKVNKCETEYSKFLKLGFS